MAVSTGRTLRTRVEATRTKLHDKFCLVTSNMAWRESVAINEFFVPQIHIETSRCLLLCLPKITETFLSDIGCLVVTGPKLTWQISFWRNGFRVTETVEIGAMLGERSDMILFEDISTGTNQIRCVLSFTSKEEDIVLKNNRTNRLSTASQPLVGNKLQIYESTIEFVDRKPSWGNSVNKPVGLNTKKFIRIITFNVDSQISSVRSRLEGIAAERNKSGEEKDVTATVKDIKLQFLRVGQDIRIAATRGIVSNRESFERFFSRLVDKVLTGNIQYSACEDEYLRFVHRVDSGILVSCQQHVFTVLSGKYESSCQIPNTIHNEDHSSSATNNWLCSLLATSMNVIMKAQSLSRADKLRIVYEFWDILPDLLIVDVINHFFRIVTQIQKLPLDCFIRARDSPDPTFQALYTLSSVLTAGVLIVSDSSEMGSTKASFILTRKILDEYLMMCSKITLHAYQRCCDAILSATKSDDDANSMSIYFRGVSPRKKTSIEICYDVLFVLCSCILGLGLQSHAVVSITTKLIGTVENMNSYQFNSWLSFFATVLGKTYFSNDYKSDIIDVLVKIFTYIRKNDLSKKLKLASVPSMCHALIRSRSAMIFLVVAESFFQSTENTLHEWVNMVVLLQLVDDDVNGVLEICQKRNDGTTARFAENLCKLFVKNVNTIGVGDEIENLVFVQKILPLWTNEASIPPILNRRKAVSILCNFVEFFTPSARLDIRSSEQLNALQNATISSLVQCTKHCIMAFARHNIAEKKTGRLAQLQTCLNLLDINLPGLHDEINDGILDEVLEIYFICTKENIEELPVKFHETVKRQIAHIVDSVFRFSSTSISEPDMRIDAEQRRRYRVLFKYLEHKCPVAALASFIETLSKSYFASSNSYIKTFMNNILQSRSDKICRDEEVMALLSLASVWMVCHPPAAVKHLERLIELRNELRNSENSTRLFICLVDNINAEYKLTDSANFLFFKTQYPTSGSESAASAVKAKNLMSSYRDGRFVLLLDHSSNKQDYFDSIMADSVETPQTFAVRHEKNNVVTWSLRFADETLSYMDVVVQLQKNYPSAIILSPKTPRSFTPKDNVSLISSAELIQIYRCISFRDDIKYHEEEKYFFFMQALYYDGMSEEKMTEKIKNSHLPRKHKHYGKSLEEWHIAEDIADGTIFKCIISIKSGENFDILSKVQQGVGTCYDAVIESCEKCYTANACIVWLHERFHNTLDLYRKYEKDSTSIRLKVLLEYMAGALDGHRNGEAIDAKLALRLIIYFQEWEADYYSNIRKDKKLEYIKLKRVATKEGKSFPSQSDYMQYTPGENKIMTELILRYNKCRHLLNECFDTIRSNVAYVELTDQEKEHFARVGCLVKSSSYV